MKFSEVEPAMKAGKKVKLDTWKKAYWYIDPETGCVMNHFEDGGEDVPTGALFPRDLVWVATGDWQIVEDDDQAATDSCEETTPGKTNDGKITREQYDKAVGVVLHAEVNNPKWEGESKMLIPLLFTVFARKLSNELFNSEQEDD